MLTLVALAAGCATADHRADPAPREVSASAFSWRVIHGGKDKIQDFVLLRDRVLSVVGLALKPPCNAGDQLAAMKLAFDEQRAPEELSATIEYRLTSIFGPRSGRDLHDRKPLGESVLVTLRREPLNGPPASLAVDLVDIWSTGADGAQVVDGRIDVVSVLWDSPRDEHVHADIDGSAGPLVESVEGPHGRETVTSPQLNDVVARAQKDLYEPLVREYAKAIALGTAPYRPRKEVWKHTSFPPPP